MTKRRRGRSRLLASMQYLAAAAVEPRNACRRGYSCRAATGACALHMRCTCTAHALHMHCTCTAHALHMRCTCAAHALHMHCTCAAHALHMHCTCTAHALHMRCTTGEATAGEPRRSDRHGGCEGVSGDLAARPSHRFQQYRVRRVRCCPSPFPLPSRAPHALS
jgi:hypothetical protein